MSNVDLYFDFSCPWSYLALVRLQDVCERNRAQLMLKPVSVARILETENPALVNQRLAANPAKASWQRKDIQDWAVMWGLKIDFPDGWPQNTERAAAAAVAATTAGAGLAFSLGVFRAVFGSDTHKAADVNDAELLGTVASEAGLDGAVIKRAANDADAIAQVHRLSLELIERGGFGTPSMFVGDALFFGNDRVPLVEWTLGPMADDDFVLPGQHSQWK